MSNLKKLVAWLGPLLYLIILALVTLHFYQAPFWDFDMLGYMGNARLHDTTDPVTLHRLVFDDLRSSVPSTALQFLTVSRIGPEEDDSRLDRLHDPFRYSEFLPCFAIRPMYNETIYWVSQTGIGLIRSVRLVSVLSYYLLGILVFAWLKRCTRFAGVLAFFIMLIPSISLLGRYTGSDGLSVLLGMLALFLIFELDRVASGLCILTAAIWFRTDNAVLLVVVLATLCYQRRLEIWKAATLGAVAVASVLTINHASGDYGIQMLYYRNFLDTPIAPGEMTARFTALQYVSVFFKGFKTMASSFVPAFLLLGVLGFNRKTAPLGIVAVGYAFLHYLILPNWIDRWMGVFYLLTCMMAAFSLKPKTAGPVRLNMWQLLTDRSESLPLVHSAHAEPARIA